MISDGPIFYKTDTYQSFMIRVMNALDIWGFKSSVGKLFLLGLYLIDLESITSWDSEPGVGNELPQLKF